MNMDPIICRNLSKTYDQDGLPVPVLHDVSLEIAAGSFTAIMGPSGSGKSTLLHCLGLLETPSGGELWLNGTNTGSLSDRQKADLRRETMGFVFQSFYLIDGLTAFENAMLPLLIARKKINRGEQVNKMLERVGLGHRSKHRPMQLSGGEQQRVAIARALVNSPRLLLLDEPTGNLDMETGRSIMDLFEVICRQDGVTAIMVTHSQEAASRCDRTIHILDGAVALNNGQEIIT